MTAADSSPPHRSPAAVVTAFLGARFPGPFLRLDTAAYREFLLGLSSRGITGGSAYDALVAATAAAHRAELVTCDRRATAIYETYAVRFQLIG